MTTADHVTIVVPCYNEEDRLDGEAFMRFSRKFRHIRFLFVNDGSNDGTEKTLKGLVNSSPSRFGILNLKKNLGKAEAVRRGILKALGTSPEYIGYWDADLATPLETIPEFIEMLDRRPELLLITGARIKLLGKEISRNPWRHYLGRIFATMVSLVLRLAVYDSQCGAKVFRTTESTVDLFKDKFISRWIFDVELLSRMTQRQLHHNPSTGQSRIFEFPLSIWRDTGSSKLRTLDFFKAPLDLFLIHRHATRSSRHFKNTVSKF